LLALSLVPQAFKLWMDTRYNSTFKTTITSYTLITQIASMTKFRFSYPCSGKLDRTLKSIHYFSVFIQYFLRVKGIFVIN